MCLSLSFSADKTKYRGVTIFKIDPFACSVIESHTFDTYASASDATVLASYMNNAATDDVLIAVTFDEPRTCLGNALSTLEAFGAPVSDMTTHESFAFVALKGYSAQTAIDKAQDLSTPARVDVVVRGTYFDFHILVLLPAF
jgi:hypothetical protein